jgi:hypothetical protein
MTRDSKQWFAVRLIMESVRSDPSDGHKLFEDRILLVKARTSDQARQKATTLAKASGHSYRTATGADVAWKFSDVLDVKSLLDETIEDGSEIYYAFLHQDELDAVREFLRSK